VAPGEHRRTASATHPAAARRRPGCFPGGAPPVTSAAARSPGRPRCGPPTPEVVPGNGPRNWPPPPDVAMGGLANGRPGTGRGQPVGPASRSRSHAAPSRAAASTNTTRSSAGSSPASRRRHGPIFAAAVTPLRQSAGNALQTCSASDTSAGTDRTTPAWPAPAGHHSASARSRPASDPLRSATPPRRRRLFISR
jgi:hypothetical protein